MCQIHLFEKNNREQNIACQIVINTFPNNIYQIYKTFLHESVQSNKKI